MTYLQTQIQNLIRLAQEQESYEPYHETLEYVSLDGTQYFDTGILGNLNTKIEAGLSVTNISSNGQLFGARNIDANKSNIGCIFLVASGSETTHITLDFNNSSYATYRMSSSAVTVNTYYDIIVSKKERTVYLDGVSKGSNTQLCSDTFASQNTITIGKVNGATGLTYGSCPSTWKYFKIYDGSNLPMDLIPVLDSKMRPCLYNRTTKTFLYAKKISDGTETYDLGFKRWNKYDVDYITFTGTQRIPTGIKPQVDIKTDITFRSDYTGSTASCLIGARYAASGVRKAYAVWQCVGGSNTNPQSGYMRADLGNSSTGSDSIGKSYLCVNWTNFVKDSADNYLNNEFKTANTSYDFDFEKTSVDINIGCMANGSVGTDEEPLAPTCSNNFIGDIGKCIMYVEGVLARDFKPVVWHNGDTTAEACLYDEVYNKMYPNAGTGSLKAYIEDVQVPYTLAKHDNMDTDGFYLAEDGTKTISSDGTSCYTSAIPVKEGDIVEWTVIAEAVTANKRIHGYTTNADIEVGTTGSWVEMLAKIVFSTTSDTTQTVRFTVPSGINYIRLSHANTREMKDSIVRIRTYVVGKAIKYPQNNGFTLNAPNSSNFILDLLTRATTTGSYYILDTRNQGGGSSEDEFGIGGSSTGSTVNWKCEGESQLIATNDTNWQRSSNYTYSQLLVGYKEGNTFKRTASFYDFNNQKISDVTVVTATRDIANNTKPLTILHTTSSNWLQYGADVCYFKYLQDDNDVWYDCIPVRNATLTSSVMLFDRANKTSLPNKGSETPTFVALD